MTAAPDTSYLSWFGIVRLGLAQTALGAIFVLATSTTNRVMVVEFALPAVVPGLLVGLHYAVQLMRPRLGHGSDVGGRRTPWILGGMAALGLGGVGAALATALMSGSVAEGIALAIPSFLLIGLGVGAAGTALLVLLADRTAPARRPAAAAVAWVLMIGGFILTAGLAGHFLDPFSPRRLVAVAAAISAVAVLLSCIAVWGVEPKESRRGVGAVGAAGFRDSLRAVWSERRGRLFAIFIFVSMLAYGGEDLLIEPFAGSTFGLSPGATAKLAGVLHGGALLGMILVGVISALPVGARAVRVFMIGGCAMSGLALVAIAACGVAGSSGPFTPLLFLLGASNGAYAVAAIGTMMQLVGANGAANEGTRMGLWGAAQALAFGAGGLVATVLSDIARHLAATPGWAYAAVFVCQAAVFIYATILAAGLDRTADRNGIRRGVGGLTMAQAERG